MRAVLQFTEYSQAQSSANHRPALFDDFFYFVSDSLRAMEELLSIVTSGRSVSIAF